MKEKHKKTVLLWVLVSAVWCAEVCTDAHGTTACVSYGAQWCTLLVNKPIAWRHCQKTCGFCGQCATPTLPAGVLVGPDANLSVVDFRVTLSCAQGFIASPHIQSVKCSVADQVYTIQGQCVQDTSKDIPIATAGPTTTAAPAAPASPTTTAAPAAPAGPTAPGGPTTPAGPTAPGGPTAPADPSTPAGPTASGGPTAPADPSTPAGTTAPGGPTARADPSTPAGTTAPGGPTAPADPGTPAGPTAPGGPTAPADPSTPAGPTAPGGPTAPADPSTPAGPTAPSGPTAPADPSTPAGTTAPGGPTAPADPSTPAGPASSQVGRARCDSDNECAPNTNGAIACDVKTKRCTVIPVGATFPRSRFSAVSETSDAAFIAVLTATWVFIFAVSVCLFVSVRRNVAMPNAREDKLILGTYLKLDRSSAVNASRRQRRTRHS